MDWRERAACIDVQANQMLVGLNLWFRETEDIEPNAVDWIRG